MNRLLFRLLTLILIPCFTLYSVDAPQGPSIHLVVNADSFPDLKVDMPFTYNDVVELLGQIEDGSIDERYTPEEMIGIVQFLVQLARLGLLPDEDVDELEADIQELLSSLEEEPGFAFAPSIATGFMFASDLHGDDEHIILCKKGFFHKCSDHVKRFCRKNKKPLLIGVVVVAVVAVATAVVVAAPVAVPVLEGAAAAAAAAGAVDQSSSSHKKGSVSHPTEDEYSSVLAIVDDSISSVKEGMAETSTCQSIRDPSFVNTARGMGSSVVHQVLDGVGQLVSIIPETIEGIGRIGSKCWPSSTQVLNDNLLTSGTPTGNFEKTLAQGHQAIDHIFDTEQASRYTHEAKETRAQLKEALGMNEVIGIIPPAGTLGKTPTQPTDVKGWKLGEDIKNLTRPGNVPSWDAVRARYWKDKAERAKANSNDYGEANLARMEKGLAPQRKSLKTGEMESMELHHDPAQRHGGLFDVVEVWPDDHAKIDPNRYRGG